MFNTIDKKLSLKQKQVHFGICTPRTGLHGTLVDSIKSSGFFSSQGLFLTLLFCITLIITCIIKSLLPFQVKCN